jgi:hypothetical protein
MSDIKVPTNSNEDILLQQYVEGLYNIADITPEEIKLWNDTYSYKGFDRKKVMKDLMKKVPDVKTAQQIIMVCGLLGPQRASLVKLINGKTIASYGIPASGLKGTDGASCQRITAATADLCAFLLKRINVPKRLNLPCPGWLQFPSAGSITMPNELRQLHIEFAKRFSTVIGGVFNEQIYEQMVANSYIDPKLDLFTNLREYITQEAPSHQIPIPAPTFNSARGDIGVPKATDSSRVKRI